ncbi:hypothetical protein GR7B_00175 [Vibrio phage vB_VcorM_GR7B]|nr:hypothetical protein GR7B_00175 [Vibrio phage vB_VcorM_GR7B]
MPKQRVRKSKNQKSDEGLSVAKLIQTTRRFRYLDASSRDVRLYRPLRMKGENGVRIEASAKSRISKQNRNPQVHRCSMECINGYDRLTHKKARVKVSCDCEFFTYTCEVALYRYGAADIIFSNGEYPYSTNPRGLPIMCKHLLSMAKAIQKKGF